MPIAHTVLLLCDPCVGTKIDPPCVTSLLEKESEIVPKSYVSSSELDIVDFVPSMLQRHLSMIERMSVYYIITYFYFESCSKCFISRRQP